MSLFEPVVRRGIRVLDGGLWRSGFTAICFYVLSSVLYGEGMEVGHSVVTVTCTSQGWDFVEPWKPEGPRRGTGTGFVIQGRRILTNAHVVADARYIEIKRIGDDKKYVGRVLFVAHDCDLAILDVEDPNFFDDMIPLELGHLPQINSTVTTYGFPVGGTQLSVTRGVVSRVQMSSYSHSGADAHMVVQTDAAINPGNSGGPVIQDGKVVGVAFQGLSQADNIGYLIPISIVEHVLEDVEDGRLDGYGELGIEIRYDLQNPMVRDLLKVPDDIGGVVVMKSYPRMPAYGELLPLDVIVEINDYTISSDGLVRIDGFEMDFTEVMEREQVGAEVILKVWREGALLTIALPIQEWVMPIPRRRPHDVVPPYFIWGGLCFTPLSRGYLDGSGGLKNASLPVRHTYSNILADENHQGEDVIVFSAHLPDELNQGADQYVGEILKTVNGEAVEGLEDLSQKLSGAEDYVTLGFLGRDIPYVVDVKEVKAVADEILTRYRVGSRGRF